jgi:dinuclear metal center YbgI/SA1388 family protein
VKLSDVIHIVEEIAPPQYAAAWDNTGLQIGSPDTPVRSILVALDVTQGVVREALRKKVNLIISHHPLFFQPIRQVRTDSGAGRLLGPLLKGDIAVYAAHTNLDVARGGVNDLLGRALGVRDWTPLQERPDAEGGSFGSIGELPQAQSLSELIEHLKKTLGIASVRVVGPNGKKVKRIAFCCGSGASLLSEVRRATPDLFITGDLKYHDAMNFLLEGIPALDVGHFASEEGIRKALAQRIRRAIAKRGASIPVYVSRAEHDPFHIM